MPPCPHPLVTIGLFATVITSGRAQTSTPAARGPVASAPPVVVTVEAHDYAFTVPARIAPGVVTIRLVNHGKESHHAQVIRLEQGKTAGDVLRVFTDTAAMPAWVVYVGGPVGTAPGQERNSTIRLTPGRYAMLCRIVSPDRKTHVMKGMIREFEVVTQRGAIPTAFPVATDTLRLNDYGFAAGRPLSAGRHVVRVENAGPQPHEVVVLQLRPGQTPLDFARWGLGGRRGPAPAMPIGGAEFLERSQVGLFELDLAKGNYGFICFVPDDKDGKRHFLHGMMAQFAVR